MPVSPAILSMVVAGLLVGALLVYGLRDWRRFSLYRTWAVSSVVFRESYRRRVLWVTPLAMLATLALIRLQDPADELDAIRQATKFCLFATGLVAVLVPLILACTNLPREIESRVIFTIVTKPISRLELLLGKVIGFAKLSALVLAIMGAFTLIVLLVIEATLSTRIQLALQTVLPQEGRRPYLQHLADDGLLRAERFDSGDDLQVYAEAPERLADDADVPRFFLPGAYHVAVPFMVNEPIAGFDPAASPAHLVVDMKLHWRQMESRQLLPGDPPYGIVNLETLGPPPPPRVRVQLLDAQLQNIVGWTTIPGNNLQLPREPPPGWDGVASLALTHDQTRAVLEHGKAAPVYVGIYGGSREYLYGVTRDSVRLRLLDPQFRELATYEPALDGPARSSILLRTTLGSFGLGLSGPEDDLPAPVGVMAFRDTRVNRAARDGEVAFELVVGVERLGGVLDESDDTRLEARVHNVRSGFTSEPVVLFPEPRRPVYFEAPAAAVEGGDFDLRLRTLSRSQIVSVRGAGVMFIVDRELFVLNLMKALLVLWLLSLLVITAGIAFSTFVSWPVAVTLCVFMLAGRWIATQLASAGSSEGRRVADAIFGGGGGDAASREAVRASVDALSSAFATITAFLPDIGAFAVVEALEARRALDWQGVGLAGWTTLAFALPLASLAYIVLRNKEVAP